MTGKKSKSVEEMKGEKEANHLRNLLCLFPSKLNIFGGWRGKSRLYIHFQLFSQAHSTQV
jgi:hypothetical protein